MFVNHGLQSYIVCLNGLVYQNVYIQQSLYARPQYLTALATVYSYTCGIENTCIQ